MVVNIRLRKPGLDERWGNLTNVAQATGALALLKSACFWPDRSCRSRRQRKVWPLSLPAMEEAGGLDLGEMLDGPFVHGHQRTGNAPSQRGERVLHLRRHLRVHRARDQAVALERPKRLGQSLLRDLPDLVVDLAIAPGAAGEQVQDIDVPLAREELKDQSSPVDHLEVGGFDAG